MAPDQKELVGVKLEPSIKVPDFPIKDMGNAIRFLSADAVQNANSGHPGMPMGMADVATVLFSQFLKYDAQDPEWADRDRFVLSAGHGSMLLYSLLHLTGYADMTMDEIKNFRQLGSKTAGHPEYGHASGIETTTGPLGQGLAMAVGMALSERLTNARFGDGLVDHHTYVIAGDGCLMEGVSHEAISFAGHIGLDKLIVLFDDNAISIDGGTGLSVSDDQMARFSACGWDVSDVDGHDSAAISEAIEAAKQSDKPSMIACKTVIGYGAPNKEGTSATHGAPLGEEEISAARVKLGWTAAPFHVPEDVLSAWRAAGARGQAERAAWTERLTVSDYQRDFTAAMAGDMPKGWMSALTDHKKALSEEAPGWATRKASGEALEVLNKAIKEMVGGSADLTGSNNTMVKDHIPVAPGDFSGRYIHYGVREFGMGAIMNGMALHGGVIPYSGTFLVFADYMRGAIRLSALMGQRVIYVLTHDSIGLGEDGPTHQPVETLASLRAIPNLNVYRPADAVETAECWATALECKTAPAAIALTRQSVPTVRTEHTEENLSARGAYILRAAEGERKATILATGSEVSIALKARAQLATDGVHVAVVSMPCWEAFDSQDDTYRASVLGTAPRVAIEAAVQLGWEKYIGETGAFIGMRGFGASAPADDLYEHFGLTVDDVVDAVKARI